MAYTRPNYPFTIEAWVLLPEHLHCVSGHDLKMIIIFDLCGWLEIPRNSVNPKLFAFYMVFIALCKP